MEANFVEGVAVTVSGVILFIGSVYLLLSAVFGLRMAYLVIAVSFFGWMIILSALWAFGAPGTPPNLGPRGTEPHWAVFAAGTTGALRSTYPQTLQWPGGPWRPPDQSTRASVDTVRGAMQEYLHERAHEQLAEQGEEVGEGQLSEAQFAVEDVRFTRAEDGTQIAGGQGFYQLGGPQVTMFAYYDKGNVPIYSWTFLAASILGFAIHLPFLDRAERKRKAILTGGTAPPWYGPA